jgi:hypothetical protein
VYEGHGIAGVGQEVVLNADLEEVRHREVLSRHLLFQEAFNWHISNKNRGWRAGKRIRIHLAPLEKQLNTWITS